MGRNVTDSVKINIFLCLISWDDLFKVVCKITFLETFYETLGDCKVWEMPSVEDDVFICRLYSICCLTSIENIRQ